MKFCTNSFKGTYNGNLNYEEVIQPLSNYKEEFNTKPTR
jgi:hypothetical protein